MNAAEIEAAQTFVFGDVRNRPCGFLWWVHSCSFLQQPPTQKGYVKESPSLEHTHTLLRITNTVIGIVYNSLHCLMRTGSQALESCNFLIFGMLNEKQHLILESCSPKPYSPKLWSFRKLGVPYFGFLKITILPCRVLYQDP